MILKPNPVYTLFTIPQEMNKLKLFFQGQGQNSGGFYELYFLLLIILEFLKQFYWSKWGKLLESSCQGQDQTNLN